MIIAPTPAFYVVRAEGDAAENIAGIVSPSVMTDITDVIVLSREFTNDIEPINELDASMETLKSSLAEDIEIEQKFNPLFIPMSLEELDDALEVEQKSDHVQFSAMNGNPFAVKIVQVTSKSEQHLITGTVSYQQFELPGYETIMEKQRTLLN